MKIKLIIWDLDDTLWSGTLAEGDDVILLEHRVHAIKALNKHGVVNAICSKNDFNIAKKQLEKFGLWQYFVFPRISFDSKGEAIKNMIEDMQLRAENVLFIDDNEHNLAEVKYFSPNIYTMDARLPECDKLLNTLIEDNAHINKSRVEQYRTLEVRKKDESQNFESRNEFLLSSNIEVAIAWRVDNIDFSERIEELINRTNQLNLLKTRIKSGTINEFLLNNSLHDAAAMFAWDNYGYYGLVGFAAVNRKTRKLVHLTFSCRIMHMGLEDFMIHQLLQLYPNLDLSAISYAQVVPEWVKLKNFNLPEVRNDILTKENARKTEKSTIRVMANCQSASIAHYSQLGDCVEFDNWPRAFSLQQVLTDLHHRQSFPSLLVYGAFNDYANQYWSAKNQLQLSTGLYEDCVDKFIEYIDGKIMKIVILLPPINISDENFRVDLGVSKERVIKFNNVWQEKSKANDMIFIQKLDDILIDEDVLDVRHYNVTGLKKIGVKLNSWSSEIVPQLEKNF